MIRIRTLLILSLAIASAAGARMQRDAMLDTLVPVAQAVIVPPAVPVPVKIAAGPAHEVSREADGLFYVNAHVNGHPIRFIVDTGASIVVLTAADARAVGVDMAKDPYGAHVETVGGSMPMVWTTLNKVNVAGHEIRGLQAGVVRDGLGVSLLGQNVLARLHSVTMTADRLSLR